MSFLQTLRQKIAEEAGNPLKDLSEGFLSDPSTADPRSELSLLFSLGAFAGGPGTGGAGRGVGSGAKVIKSLTSSEKFAKGLRESGWASNNLLNKLPSGIEGFFADAGNARTLFAKDKPAFKTISNIGGKLKDLVPDPKNPNKLIPQKDVKARE